MNKLEKYIFDYGTDSLEAMIQAMTSREVDADFKKCVCKMVADLTAGLREYGMSHDLKNKVADYR